MLSGPAREPEELEAGLYEEFVTERIRARVDALVRERLARTQSLDPSDQARDLGQHVGDAVARALEYVPVSQRIDAVNQLLSAVEGLLPPDIPNEAIPLAPGPSVLLEVLGRELGATPVPRPKLSLRRSDLLVNARGEPQLARELAAEIQSATSVDLLCAFLKWSGVVLIREALAAAVSRGVSVRVLTTTYMGATDQRAIDELVDLGARVGISYETHRTRLHAKAWLFRRRRQLDTAYVGSSNLSRAAMTDGLEWNVRLSRAENGPVLDKFAATFEAYWNSSDFELYEPQRDKERLRMALSEGRNVDGPGQAITLPDLDVRPYPFQQEILDRLEAERTVHGYWQNLVVSATGTGKTVVAALDYKRLSTWSQFQPKLSLLFVAHRAEILRQSQARFRQVLRDPTFGELFLGGNDPSDWKHVFASVQSLAQVDLERLPRDRYDVVIVDEFHHAEAPTYRRLLEHLQPKCLLGLTATPERADGLDVRRWFNGRTAAELRLWEALERDLLCPFHYFVAYDGVDVTSIEWKRGGYDVGDLDRLYTGNDARADVVLRELADKVVLPGRMRALGFCVSVAHAEFMARFTNQAGLKAAALSGSTPAGERSTALRRLRQGELQIIYSVDLFNEGLDLPEIDVVLLLRPTESATVFLQQLGRGLRHSPEKSHLTVLDFVGYQHKQFRFDLRFQALTGLPRGRLAKAIEEGFPFLPSGCHIQLDRVASRVVLDNVRGQVRSDIKSLVADARAAGDVNLASFLAFTGRPLSDLYRSGRSWTDVRRLSGLDTLSGGGHEDGLLKRLFRFAAVDDLERSRTWHRWLTDAMPPAVEVLGLREQRLAAMLFFLFWPNGGGFTSYQQGFDALWQEHAVRGEAIEMLALVEDQIDHVVHPLPEGFEDVPMWVHAHYSRDELLAGLGHASLTKVPTSDMQGVRYMPHLSADVFTFTVQKSERDYSPTTMYRDYPISPELMHWESQNTTSATSRPGRRYVEHAEQGSHVLLFGRLSEKDDFGTAPFLFVGPANYESSEGSNPIAIRWRLIHRLPLEWFNRAGVLAG